jgi:hypothetical protein
MPESPWDVKRSLRIDLLNLIDQIETISIKYRSLEIEQDIASEINALQIKMGEIIGKLFQR